jgi:O-antigen ligase
LAQTTIQGPFHGGGYLAASLGWLVFFLTFTLTKRLPSAMKPLILLLILLAGIETCIGLIQSLGGVDYIGSYHRGLGRQATGTFINHNHYAGFLNMVIPLAAGILVYGFPGRVRKYSLPSEVYSGVWIGIIGVSLMALAVLLSLSRAGSATLLGTLAFLAVLILISRQRRTHMTLSSLTPALIVLMSLLLAFGLGLDALMTRFYRLEGSWQDRSTVYRDTLRLISDNPLAGVGPGMYQWRFRPYQTLSAGTWWKHAHSDYLQVAAEWGVPAALLFWGFVVWSLCKSVRGFLVARSSWTRGTLLGTAGAIFSIMLHGLVDFNLHIPANLMVFCVLLGLVWRLDQERSGRAPYARHKEISPSYAG